MIRFTLLTMALVTLIGLTSWSDMIVDGEIDDWTNVANDRRRRPGHERYQC